MALTPRRENPRRQTLRRLPAIEIVAVVPGEDDEILFGQVVVDPHRRGETPQERQRGPLRHIAKDDRPLGILEFEHAACEFVGARVRRRQRHVAAIGADEAERERHRHRQLDVLSRRRRKRLRDVEPVGFAGRVVSAANGDLWRAGLLVPAHELREIASRNRLETADEVLNRRSMDRRSARNRDPCRRETLPRRSGASACARPRRPSDRRSRCRSC